MYEKAYAILSYSTFPSFVFFSVSVTASALYMHTCIVQYTVYSLFFFDLWFQNRSEIYLKVASQSIHFVYYGLIIKPVQIKSVRLHVFIGPHIRWLNSDDREYPHDRTTLSQCGDGDRTISYVSRPFLFASDFLYSTLSYFLLLLSLFVLSENPFPEFSLSPVPLLIKTFFMILYLPSVFL